MPDALSRFGIIGIHPRAQLAPRITGRARKHLALYEQRSRGDLALALDRVLFVDVPCFFPGLRIDGNDVVIHRTDVNFAVSVRETARSAPLTLGDVGSEFIGIGPDPLTRCRIDGIDIVLHTFDEQDAIDDQWW